MKFSIVTPAYNMEKWIAQTIESVLSQEGDFEIEYIVIDNGSKDKTHEIALRYKKNIDSGDYKIKCNSISMICINQENTGMYEAINHGFSLATGDIHAWINADDIYKPKAFENMRLAFSAFPNAEWIKGITNTIDESSVEIRKGACKIYRRDWLELGIYGQEAYFVEQDSVFWKKELWDKVGPIPKDMRSAGDYWLWMQMAKHTELWSLNVPISSFRKRDGQISKNVKKYKEEQSMARPKISLTSILVKLFFTPQSRIIYKFPRFEKIFLKIYSLLFLRKNDTYIDIVDNTINLEQFTSYKV